MTGVGVDGTPGAGAPQRVPRVPSVEELTRVVALDGPAGSGKSTVSRLVAEALGWRFVDTGATYRALTLAVLRAGVDPEADGSEAALLAAVRDAEVLLLTDPSAPRVLLDGVDVSVAIRSPEVTRHVSAVSAVPAVRQRLIELQRQAMGVEGAVVEGRDIATVVAPLAAVKVYLDARPEVRAARRAGDTHTGVVAAASAGRASAPVADQGDPAGASGLAPGASAATDAVAADLARRDARDHQTNRLEVSEGALHLDTSDLSLSEVVAAIVRLVRDAGLQGAAAPTRP